jgi:hypothetical protein
MKLAEILETPGCELLNDWLMLNFGQTLEDTLPKIEEGEEEEELVSLGETA